MNHLRLIEHPLAHRTVGIRPGLLYVGGNFPYAPAGLAYRGAVNVYNAIGDCTVQLISGTLPGGATLTMDNATKQIVISWPKPETAVVRVPNGGFEEGQVGWECGDGWSIVPVGGGVPATGAWVAIHNGGSSSYIDSAPVACGPNVAVSCTASWYPGFKNGDNVDLYTIIQFLDASKNVIGQGVSAKMHGSNPGGLVPLSASGVSPSGTAYARVQGFCYRRKYARPVSFDDVTWTITTEVVGVATPGSYPLTLRVTDSAGRTADWSGTLVVAQMPIWAQGGELWEGTPNAMSRIGIGGAIGFPDGNFFSNRAPGSGSRSTDTVQRADGTIVLAYSNVNLTPNRRIMRYDAGTRQWVVLPTLGAALPAGAGYTMRFHPSGDWLLIPYFDGTLYTYKWDGTNYVEVSAGAVDLSGAINAYALAWNATGDQFVITDSDSNLRKFSFDTSTGAVAHIQTIAGGGNNGVTGVDWQGNYIVYGSTVGGGANYLRVVNATTMTIVAQRAMPTGGNLCPHLSIDARSAYCCGSDGNVYTLAFDPVGNTLSLVNTYLAIAGGIDELAFSRNREYMSFHGGTTSAFKNYAVSGTTLTALTLPTINNGTYEAVWLI